MELLKEVLLIGGFMVFCVCSLLFCGKPKNKKREWREAQELNQTPPSRKPGGNPLGQHVRRVRG